uniref:Thromboxane-A synthase n=1 Tax=Myripristis murdjan TaxID=586833 RepID=A0A667YWT6_9TELE
IMHGIGFWNTCALSFSLSLCRFSRYSVSPFSVLSRCGIKHPKPLPFFGNMFMFRQGFFEPLNDLIRTHGRVCGYYLGRRPVVVVADPDMLRQVMVKEFSTFPNRMTIRFSTKPMTDCLLLLRDERWKRVRSILTPSFSAAKMKEVKYNPILQNPSCHCICPCLSVLVQMVPLINTATDALMNNLNAYAESGEAFDIHRCFGCFTMDVIASVAFGTQVDSQNNPDDPFVHHAQKFFSFNFFRPIFLLFIAFPFIMAPLAGFIPNKRRDEMNNFFISCIQKIIKQRDEQPPEQRRRDFLQLMLDVRSSKECVSLEHFDVVNHADELDHTHQQTHQSASEQDNDYHQPQVSHTKHPQKRMMTEDEIVGQAFIFLLAGYETSSNTLAFTCYLLAIHPDCQSKVQEEVDHFFTRHESPDYTNVQELKYLDMVIAEALRLYPPGFRFARSIDHDCVVNGQFLPKGATLEIPASFLHYDPEYWPEPEKFIPERFTPEAKANRHPFAYLPFGAGPRSCVGMRLAQLEMKMALVRLFRRFNVVTCSETKIPLELKSSSTLGPKNGIFVKITRRDLGEDQGNPTTR